MALFAALDKQVGSFTTTEKGALAVSAMGLAGATDAEFLALWNKLIQGFTRDRIVDAVRSFLKTALDADADIVGINNRDLRSFVTDLAVTERLAGMVPSGKIVVSESGVSSRDQVDRVGRAGAHAVLVGEALVTAKDVAAKLKELI